MSQRQGCASHKSTNKQIPSEASEVPSDTVIHFFFFFLSVCVCVLRARLPVCAYACVGACARVCACACVSAFNQSEARFVELGEYSQKILSEAFWTPTPNIASSQFDEYPERYICNIREAKVRPIKNQLYSPNTSNSVHDQMFAQLRTGFRKKRDSQPNCTLTKIRGTIL